MHTPNPWTRLEQHVRPVAHPFPVLDPVGQQAALSTPQRPPSAAAASSADAASRSPESGEPESGAYVGHPWHVTAVLVEAATVLPVVTELAVLVLLELPASGAGQDAGGHWPATQ
jgi:hypothetical protein